MPPNTLRVHTDLHAEIVEVEIEVVSPSIVPLGNFAELNRTVTCMVLKANDRRTSCPCHDEFRGPRSDYVRQGLELIEDSVSRLCSHMNLKCKNCSFFKGFPTTEKIKGSCLINSSIVWGLRIIGKGFSAGKKLCAFLGLPFLSKLAFRNQERKLLKATERVAQENINAALSEIKGSNSFTKCGISIDGTWQRRGYSSLNGCVSAI
ncbi:CCHC-type domain-containing protein [Trichonephila clavipes]|nr:CCHC-type domain-containing protein [Trichonephila clavipes]